MHDRSVSWVQAAGVYPTIGGDNLGVFATTPFIDADGTAGDASAGDQVNRAVAIGASGEPQYWWVAVLVFFIAAMWASEKYGEGSFSNIKLGLHSVIFCGVSALIFITGAKVIFSKYPVPGLSAVVLAA